MPRALVTGGTGFLGGHLAAALAGAGWEVRTLDLNPPPPDARHEFVRADATDPEAVRDAAAGCELIVDNAALVPVTRASAEDFRLVNVGATRVALGIARETGAYPLHISSSAIYGVPAELPVRPETPLSPFEPYGASKAEAERLVADARSDGLAVASLRPRTLIGAGRMGVMEVVFSRVRAGTPVPVFGRGTNRVQLCDTEDFCAAALAAVERRASGDYNIGAAEYGTVREDIGALIDHAGTGSRVQPVPAWAVRALLAPFRLLGRSPLTEWHLRTGPRDFYFDISKAQAELDWHPRRSNAEALISAYESYLKTPDEDGDSAHRRPLEGGLGRVLRGNR